MLQTLREGWVPRFVFLLWLSRWLTFSLPFFLNIGFVVACFAPSFSNTGLDATINRNLHCGRVVRTKRRKTISEVAKSGTWIGLSCWHEWHGCSHLLAILFEQLVINSLVQFRSSWVNWSRWNYSKRTQRTEVIENPAAWYVDSFVLLLWLVTFAHISLLSFWTDNNELMGSIPSKVGKLT